MLPRPIEHPLPAPADGDVGLRSRLSPACSLHRIADDGGPAEHLLATGTGRQFRISALAYRVLGALDGETSLEEIASRLAEEGVATTGDELGAFLARHYGGLGVFAAGAPATAGRPARGKSVESIEPSDRFDGISPRIRSRFPLLALGALLPRRWVGPLARATAWLFARPVAAVTLPLVALAHLWIYGSDWIYWSEWSERSPLALSRLSPESYLAIVALIVGSMVVHELGHAAAVARYGGEPGGIGVGLYLLMPTFYADVSQVWRLSRQRRMVVDAGGAYFQQLSFAALALAAGLTGRPEAAAACRAIDLMVLVALNPIFRFDGYWLVADYLGIPKLHGVALRYPLWRLRQRLGRPVEPLPLPPLRPAQRWVFSSYSLLATLFLAAALWLSARYLSSGYAGLRTAVPSALQGAADAWRAGQPLAFAAAVAAAFLLLALGLSGFVGALYYSLRAGLWCVRAISQS
jgi:putative peptide zinc metalloprotease protein